MQAIVRNATRLLRGVFVFRIFVAAFAALFLAVYSTFLPPGEIVGVGGGANWVMLFTATAALFMFIPGLERRLGRKYLPLALALAVVAFSLELAPSYMNPGVQVIITLRSGQVLSQYWAPTEAILLALVPCVLAGAVYGVSGAAAAASLATLIHLSLGVIFWRANLPLHGFFSLLPLRIAVLYGFPLMAGFLADVWRREHMAVQDANRQLRGHAATVEQLATSRERVRLARDMHDTLAHTLSALVVQLEAVDALQAADPAAAAVQLGKARQQARVGLDETRRAILDLRSSPVEELGLPAALEWLAERHAAGLTVEGEPAPLPAVQANALYRIAEEALNNATRHAGADRVSVSLCYGDAVTLQVVDNGRGFDPAAIEPERVGLVGIFERAALVGGEVTVESGPEQGTLLSVRVVAA